MMKLRSLLLAALCALVSLSVAYAKSYEFDLQVPMKAADVQLKPGTYNVEVKGTDAVFTDSKRKTYKVPVKVSASDVKNKATSVESFTQDGAVRIRYIYLEGSSTKLEFAN